MYYLEPGKESEIAFPLLETEKTWENSDKEFSIVTRLPLSQLSNNLIAMENENLKYGFHVPTGREQSSKEVFSQVHWYGYDSKTDCFKSGFTT